MSGPMPWTIRVYPRARIAEIVPDEDFLWISVTDPGKPYEPRP